MIERNRPNVVSKDDINKLEDKIKDLEDQIFNAKKKGEENRKLDYLEHHLMKTMEGGTNGSFIVNENEKGRGEAQNNSTRAHGDSEKIFEDESGEEYLLDENKIIAI
jgi:hypothetical protein